MDYDTQNNSRDYGIGNIINSSRDLFGMRIDGLGSIVSNIFPNSPKVQYAGIPVMDDSDGIGNNVGNIVSELMKSIYGVYGSLMDGVFYMSGHSKHTEKKQRKKEERTSKIRTEEEAAKIKNPMGDIEIEEWVAEIAAQTDKRKKSG